MTVVGNGQVMTLMDGVCGTIVSMANLAKILVDHIAWLQEM
jgi:hypothetical protein